jgi:hypothetical protein
MILEWTSSVNQLVLPTAGVDEANYSLTYTYEDVMKHHVWNLYTSLTQNGWTPVSSSYSSSAGYQVGTQWASKQNLVFPEKMSNDSLIDLEYKTSRAYTPVDHCWVTLKKTFDTSNYFMTIDCRYPLPPHVSNTSVLYKYTGGTNYQVLNRSEQKKVFLGPAAVIIDGTLVDTSGKNAEAWANDQETNSFDGIAIRESNVADVKFDMSPTAIKYGQDYASRCVAFVDLVFTQDDSLEAKDGSDYKSGTTSVRPKSNANDTNSWYVCWGFDFLDSATNSMKDYVDLSKYYYAFHNTKQGEFIYQIYKAGDGTQAFRSGIGFLPVKNKHVKDIVDHISFLTNCNPAKVYSTKSINFNTMGNKVKMYSGTDDNTFVNNVPNAPTIDSEQLNNFFNTCYRNYNFSDGIVSITAGEGDKIGRKANLHIYAPTSPNDASLMAKSYSQISTEGISNLTSPAVSVLVGQVHNGSTETEKFKFPTVTDATPIYSKKINGQYVASLSTKTPKSYNVFTFDTTVGSPGVNKKRLVMNGNVPLTKTFSDVVSSTATNLVPCILGSNVFQKLFFTIPINPNASAQLTKIDSRYSDKRAFITDFFDEKIFINSDSTKKIRIYVGKNDAKIPANFSGLTTLNTTIYNLTSVNTRDNRNRVVANSFVGPKSWQEVITFGLTDGVKAEVQKLYSTYETVPAIADITIEDLAIAKSANITSAVQSGLLVDCYIDVDIEDIYDFLNPAYVGQNTKIFSGDFMINQDGNTTPVTQEKGTSFFSVFKSSVRGKQQPLVGCTYAVGNSLSNIDSRSVFGTINKTTSTNDKRFLVESDTYRSYSEMPIFLLSLVSDYQEIKGYVPDILWAPTSIQEGSVVASNGEYPKTYKKVYWGGCWFPWVANDGPEF